MSNDRLDELDYYTLLGVTPKDSPDAIRAAFRAFALKYHPDRHVGRGRDAVERATAIYRRGSEALEVLTDLTQKKAYDKGLARGELRLTQAAVPSRRPPAMKSAELQSPGAKAFYARALQAAKAGDLQTARRMIASALDQEPGHPLLLAAEKKLRA